jgi:hypothetical protein
VLPELEAECTSTVQKWEIGAKRPSGPSLKLLNVINTKGVDVLSSRTGPPNLTDVLIAGIRLAHRMRDSHDNRNFASGGALVRLNLSVEECQKIIAEAAEEVRALERVFRA